MFAEIRSLQIFLEELQNNNNSLCFSKEEIINLLYQRIKLLSSHELNYQIRGTIPKKFFEENENFSNITLKEFKQNNNDNNYKKTTIEKGFPILLYS